MENNMKFTVHTKSKLGFVFYKIDANSIEDVFKFMKSTNENVLGITKEESNKLKLVA